MEIDIILLGILSGGDFFGYQIMKIIRSVMTDVAEVTTGTLYYKLKGLEKRGCLASSSEQEGLRPRRLRYSITAKGRKDFQRLAMENLISGKRPYWSYLSSLFFVQYLPADKALHAVGEKASHLQEVLARLRVTRNLMKKNDYPFHALLLVDHGISHLRVDIAWLKTFASSLQKSPSSLEDYACTSRAWEEHAGLIPSPEGESP
jgi:DNA-binding PadR family transcriptional regulator